MEIIKRKTKQCLDCSYYKGYVIEKYNGKVPVICYCTLRNANIKKPNPVIIGYPDGNLYWKPISDHIGKDGQLWHTPYFAMGSCIASPVSKRKKNNKN